MGNSVDKVFDHTANQLDAEVSKNSDNRIIGAQRSTFCKKAVSISAGGLTGFLQPTQSGGLDLSQRSKSAFPGASSAGLFEGSSQVLSTSGLSGSMLKDTAKIFTSSFVAGCASAELQSRVNFKQDASLKDILSAVAMWGVTGSALHFSGKMFSGHHANIEALAKEEAPPAEHAKVSTLDGKGANAGDGKPSEPAESFAIVEKPSIFEEVPTEMAKLGAEAASMKKHDEPPVRASHRTT